MMFSKQDLISIVSACQNYIDQTDNIDDKENYQAELDKVKGDFFGLINSGVFHDAIGKVVEKTADAVVVTTEY